MPYVAIVGAGPIGAQIAQALARRERVIDVRLFDSVASVAAGKALDIRQSGPVDGYDTRVTGDGNVLGAAGAAVTVVADDSAEGEWTGDRGLALIRRLRDAGSRSPIVFAGPGQTWLMETAVRELNVPTSLVVGTAAAALSTAARGLVALETNGSGADVSLHLVGRPPVFTCAWSSATAGGSLVTDRVPAHRLLAISQQLRALWPVGPYAIASVSAPVVETLLGQGRRELPAVTVLDGEFGLRQVAALLPVRLGSGRVVERLAPSLSPQERNEMLTTLSRSSVTG